MKILIADDDRISRGFLEKRLGGWGDEVIAVGDGSAAWEVLRCPDAPRLAILDWMMPGMDGPEVCRAVRRLAAAAGRDAFGAIAGAESQAYTYLLLATARGNTGDIITGLEAGADDYLVKPVNPHELRARLQTARRILHLQEQLLAVQEELRVKASRDALTGLWNRGATLEMLKRELAVGQRTGAPVSVLMSDLDHFKRINDTHGHLAGDAVLRETAARMQSVVRQTDWVGRYGGEEFLIVLPDCDGAMSITLGERVRQVMSAGPMLVQEGRVPVTASVGVAWAGPDWDGDATQLLRVADEALYRAKARGRNRVETAFEIETLTVA